ncbi:hypothetical protein Plhal304r1_c044g0125171 [Plasmopara halstedii]
MSKTTTASFPTSPWLPTQNACRQNCFLTLDSCRLGSYSHQYFHELPHLPLSQTSENTNCSLPVLYYFEKNQRDALPPTRCLVPYKS